MKDAADEDNYVLPVNHREHCIHSPLSIFALQMVDNILGNCQLPCHQNHAVSIFLVLISASMGSRQKVQVQGRSRSRNNIARGGRITHN